MRVGFIGIGNMGWPMAVNVLKSRHRVIVHDANVTRSARFAAENGCERLVQLRDLAAADFLITMLPDARAVRNVYLEEAGGAARHLQFGTIAIDMSSSNPFETRVLAQKLAPHGVTVLDAPVSGSAALTIMLGGDDPPAIERAKPLLASMGDRLIETGALGTGHAAKALNSFVGGAGYAAAAEAVLVARRLGIEARTLLEILSAATERNVSAAAILREHVVGRKLASGFALGPFSKDVAIAAELGKHAGLDAPLTRVICRRFKLARDRLGTERDSSEALISWDITLKQ